MLTLFFVDSLPTAKGSNFEFVGDDALHAIKALRMNVGEIFNLSNGKGAWSRVEALEVDKKSILVKVIESGFEEPLATTLTVIQAVPKGDRVKESIELSTEGGADRIIMWQAARSIGKIADKNEKLQITAREASKQSRRFRIPEVQTLQTSEITELFSTFDAVLICHESATAGISQSLSGDEKSVAIVIGPEGGLTDGEVEAFIGAGGRLVVMGRPVLRSAHAGLAALSAVNTALSLW